ncbi:two-component system, OmpR family, phosphate regulon response regulator PhoB [Alkalispirochaeta americana]|uniref:Two-component system, OmpR family, phosphate regulon response regulator PhoB n=1 Tax=Alkalispirochaeta americana TaxID=159291 RepID=A0A1N6QS25_9SPIO|nr:response regulator transcription factor [Alkalispirochaeta americana]SIQ19403.1 two-component system, OmpR family, phosphate regulon response regulator PhoB [Alkalispirochaeta americana]
MARVFVIEDNEGLREAIVSYLELSEHQVYPFGTIDGVIEAARTLEPELFILDVMLPDGDGFHLARSLRKHLSTPIIFLTARTSESDRITGFELGGDDYVTKPFSMKELVLRVRAVLSRAALATGPAREEALLSGGPRASGAITARWILPDTPEAGMLCLEEEAHRITLGEKPLDLTAAEWRVLHLLAGNEGIVFSRERILSSALDYIHDASTRTVDTHIKNIRSKLGNPAWIQTVRSFGYRFAGTKPPPVPSQPHQPYQKEL